LATDTKTNLQITIKDLLESGAHFGHQKHRWNPKMKRYIFEERNGIYIIDLAKTMQQIRLAVEVAQETVGRRKSILFVGTKKQAKAVVRECAEECGEFYMCERWLGGTLTNLTTIRQSVKTLERIEKRIASGGEGFTKKELSQFGKEQIKLERNLSGIRAMRKPPGLLIVVDPSREHIAVAEANKLGIPVMALVDTNCNPDPIDYVIACNDDALKSIKVIMQEITRAIVIKKAEVQMASGKQGKKGDESEGEEHPGEGLDEKILEKEIDEEKS
jgi:small subunit ribosomal protein S2